MQFSKILKLSNLTLLAVASGVFQIQASVLAAESTVVANLNYEQVSQETAIASGINVSVNPGRIAVIDFSATDEAISYLGLGDASQVVYNTDFPIQSGMAQTIFLLPIEELEFPGATTTKITNLVAKTVDAGGVSRVYNFQINHSNSVANLGIKIMPQTSNAIADVNRSGIKVSYGRTANLDDVARGLTLAISRGFTTADDPVVSKVRRFIALARNGELTVLESAQSAEIDLAVISSLAEMALDQFSLLEGNRSAVSVTTPKAQRSDLGLVRLNDRDELSDKQTDSRDKPAKVISDSSKEQSADIESNGEVKTFPGEETTPVNRIDSVLNAHALYFGWQKVVRQGRLEIDALTQAKVERAINLVSRGSSLKAALIEADIDGEVGSLLLAISRGDSY